MPAVTTASAAPAARPTGPKAPSAPPTAPSRPVMPSSVPCTSPAAPSNILSATDAGRAASSTRLSAFCPLSPTSRSSALTFWPSTTASRMAMLFAAMLQPFIDCRNHSGLAGRQQLGQGDRIVTTGGAHAERGAKVDPNNHTGYKPQLPGAAHQDIPGLPPGVAQRFVFDIRTARPATA